MTEVLWISARSPIVMAGSGSTSSSDRAKAASSSSSGTSTGRSNARSGKLSQSWLTLFTWFPRKWIARHVVRRLNSWISEASDSSEIPPWYLERSDALSEQSRHPRPSREICLENCQVLSLMARFRVTLIPLSQKSPNPHSQVLFSSWNLTSF